MSKYNDPDLITTELRYKVDVTKRVTIFLIIISFNGLMGLVFGILGMFHYKEPLFFILSMFLTISIAITTVWGLLDYKQEQKRFRLIIVISSVLSLLTLLVTADVLSFNTLLMSITGFGIGILELVFLCYNFVIGQKEDRNVLLGERIDDAKRKKRREINED